MIIKEEGPPPRGSWGGGVGGEDKGGTGPVLTHEQGLSEKQWLLGEPHRAALLRISLPLSTCVL